MSGEIEGKRIAFVAADGVERVELVRPWDAVENAGGTPSLISLEGGSIRSFWASHPLERQVALWHAAGLRRVEARRLSLGGALVLWGTRE